MIISNGTQASNKEYSLFRFSRMAQEDITIKGLHIPAGMSCHFPLYTIHHDPEFWTDPEKFDPDR